MADETQGDQGSSQATTTAASQGQAATTTTDAQGAEDKQQQKLSDENAKWRLQVRNLEAKVKELEPKAKQFDEMAEAQKTEAQKQSDRIAELERQVNEKDAAAQAAQRQAKLTVLATKANVDLDLLELIDISKLDLEDEQATFKVLSKLAKVQQNGGGASNPGRNGTQGMSDEELRKQLFGGRRSTIFGG